MTCDKTNLHEWWCGQYILNANGDPEPCYDLATWAEWYEKSMEQRIVARDEFDGVWVSTVFLAIDHSFGGRIPILYETMVFVSEWRNPDRTGLRDLDCDRYHTKEEALVGHAEMVAKVKAQLRQLARN